MAAGTLLLSPCARSASGSEACFEAALLDWDDLRFFLAIARTGSLSAAARELRVTQSTAGRRLASLEADLGARLLHRTPEGYAPTLAGEVMQDPDTNAARGLAYLALGLQRGGGDAGLALAGYNGGHSQIGKDGV